MSRTIRSYKRQACALLAAAAIALTGCGVSLTTGSSGESITLAAEILGLRFSFTIGGPPINTEPNQAATAAVGFRLFEETPTMTPPSGTMTLPSSAVGVGQRLAKTLQASSDLPLNGSGTITFRVASGTSADRCDSAVLLAEYELVYNSGVVAILNEDYVLSREALEIIVTNDVTICIEILVDFSGSITLGDFDMSFGGDPVVSGSLIADFRLVNDDTFENIHLLLPGQDFPDNRLTPGASIAATAEVAGGNAVTVRAGRNGVVLASTNCPAALGSNYNATVSWDGLTVTCDATQDTLSTDAGTIVEDEPVVPPGTIIQVPVDSPFGSATLAPVTNTLRGVDYGIVAVLYDQTPLSPASPPAPKAMNVDLNDLGLASVSRVYMIVHSSFVGDLPNGVDMGALTVTYAEGGSPTVVNFVLGSNTSEWAYDRPELQPVPHSLADTILTFPTMIGSASTYNGREFAVNFSVDSSRTIACVDLEVPDGATYAIFRDPGVAFATYASQYVAAMTFEGPAGTPSAVGTCPADDDDDEPICVADGFCNPLCVDVDDPDCAENCTADGECNEDCAEGEDPDCAENCTPDGECNENCPLENPDPDCDETCEDDGFCNENCSVLTPDPDCADEPGTTPQCTAESDFESGDEGWTIIGDAQGGSDDPTYVISGGNPGAYILAVDDAQGGTFYFQAPAKYHGNFAGAYGQMLSFDLLQSDPSDQFDNRDVIISGGGSLIWFDTANNPASNWTSYSITLDAAAGWMLNDDTLASEADIREVLGGITDLQIRGEFHIGTETGQLDNAVLQSDCE